VVLLLLCMVAPELSVGAPLFPSNINPREFVKHVRDKFFQLQQIRRELEFQRVNGFGEGSNDNTWSSMVGHRAGSRTLSQTSGCADREAELVTLAKECQATYQTLACHGPNLLDGVCNNACIAKVLTKHAEFESAGCTTAYKMDASSRDLARVNSANTSAGPECQFDRECCPDEVCTDQKCVFVEDLCRAQVCMNPFSSIATNLGLTTELLLGEILCSRTDETGGFCASQFLMSEEATCVKARSLGCCVYTMEFFEKSCGFNSTLGVNFTKMRTSCGLPTAICSNVNAEVSETCKVTAADANGARGEFAAWGSAAALMLFSAWLSVQVTLG